MGYVRGPVVVVMVMAMVVVIVMVVAMVVNHVIVQCMLVRCMQRQKPAHLLCSCSYRVWHDDDQPT